MSNGHQITLRKTPNLKFKYGEYVKTRTYETLRLMELKIIGSVGISALQGSSVRGYIVDYLRDNNREYLHLSEEHFTGFTALSISERIEEAVEADRFILISNAEYMSGNRTLLEKISEITHRSSWEHGGMALCGSTRLYDKPDLRFIIDNLDLYMMFKRR
jgi:hypothetical protein